MRKKSFLGVKRGSAKSYAIATVTGIIVGGAVIWSLREIWSLGSQRPLAAVVQPAAIIQQPSSAAQAPYDNMLTVPYGGSIRETVKVPRSMF